MILTSWAVGIFVAGLLLRNGLGAESMAWTIMFLFLPLTCVYYPVAVLPDWLQYVAWALPPTYVFEGMRALVIDHVFRADLMAQAFALNAVLFAVASLAFFQASAERTYPRLSFADRRVAEKACVIWDLTAPFAL